MRILKATAAAMLLALGACVDVDMDIAVLGPDEVTVTGHFEMQRMFYDMAAAGGDDDDFCPEDEGTLVLTDAAARCELSMSGSYAEVFPDDGTEQPRLTDLGDGTVRVEVPLGDFTGEAGEMAEDPQMAAMLRPMFEGNAMTFRVSGAEIISTNGELSDDGRSAVFSLPLVSLLDPDLQVPEIFETVVRY